LVFLPPSFNSTLSTILHTLHISDTMAEKHPAQSSPQILSDTDTNSVSSEDQHVMAQMGKRQQLKRRFNGFTIFGLSVTLIASWESLGAALGLSMTAGGPVSVVYGLLFTFTGSMACAASIAEMASICPISGAQYHWTYIFAPKRWRVLVTFIQGETA
jgi:choline transport protein